MMQPSWVDSISQIFRLVGKLKVIHRLYELLQHGQQDARGRALEQAANTTKALHDAAQKRVETIKSVTELMSATGFTDDEIRDYVRNNLGALSDVAEAIETLSQYIQNGTVSIKLIEDDQNSTQSITHNLHIRNSSKFNRARLTSDCDQRIIRDLRRASKTRRIKFRGGR